ncbi:MULTISPECIES: acyl-CoA reductase [Spirosoma]|uniref:Acyl-CoA reductase n=1 Tax=Spirosoma sordidisoli TaxID=2502893 RepID=A0A4Q2UMG0_9BACT|nr:MULTISPECIES: acyl-CoA reductase [Spirosoma]RYC70817.1 acyl-CoA reductase [Spirosoma sordidisoli]
MLQSERLQTFIALGDFLRSAEAQPELTEIAHRAHARNNWFTVANSLNALSAIADEFLTAQKLTDWASSYRSEPDSPKQVGVVMAGNIPAVGFHDLLCVLMSGHALLAKLSSQDFVLIHYLIQKIKEINPAFDSLIVEAERLNAAEAYIATGSNNSARYFDYYFASKPHIIRKNRSSVALLIGEESDDELLKLDHDLSDYYGLGCRNVSTLLVPEGYDFTPLLRTLEPLANRYLDNHKYQNNYDYNKSIYLINGVPHYDNGYLLVTENDALVSPISVVYYHIYQTQDDARNWLDAHKAQIQVIASAQGWLPGSVPFGKTQRPGLTDYADGIDTMAFLSKL